MKKLPCALAVLALLTGSACASSSANRRSVPAGTARPDQYLFDRGQASLSDKKWLAARDYFKQVDENYAQSPLRPDSKLAIGDTYMGEGSTEALVMAINEFGEFLSYYPTNARADYAQYKLALAHLRQMRNPERDQSETRDAIQALDTFVTRYPNSTLMPEVKTRLREAKDRLSTSDYNVGFFYFKNRWYPGALERLTSVLKNDPEFTTRDDVYFYLGESLIKLKREAEALPYYERLLKEFEKSEHLEDAKRRVTELKAQMAAKETSAP
ncbi:MAG TPA: outer membrane protein assembly factor BamD [Vicinamibacterales bacterium]|nr:outer membrane protein assembly factor BamD [Vicinamibacterales bacterium]